MLRGGDLKRFKISNTNHVARLQEGSVYARDLPIPAGS